MTPQIINCPGTDFFTSKVIKHLYKIASPEYDEIKFTKESMVKTQFTYFMNGELKCKILESIRGKDIYIIQDVANQQEISMNCCKNKVIFSTNDHIMALSVAIDSARHASAGKITVVLPTFPYGRQHKKNGREGLTASLICWILENMGVSRVLTLDIHSKEIENSFHNATMENLYPGYQIIQRLIKLINITDENFVVVSPDTGAVERNRFYANELRKPLAMLYKERDYSKVSQTATDSNIVGVKLLGDVKNKICFIADDIIGTGGTLLKAMSYLKSQGADKIISAISLPLFNNGAMNDFDKAYKEGLFYRIIGTNAIFHKELLKKEWYVSTDISGLFAHSIYRLFNNESLSELLDNKIEIQEMIDEVLK